MCLVHVLTELGFTPGLAHVNHGWRGEESDQDARFVGDLAARLDLVFFECRSRTDSGDGNLEAAARKARHGFFQEIMEREVIAKLALAHSADDRVETFLFHLLRGSGARGLVSMRGVSGHIVRPLIRTTRAEIEDYLEERKQTLAGRPDQCGYPSGQKQDPPPGPSRTDFGVQPPPAGLAVTNDRYPRSRRRLAGGGGSGMARFTSYGRGRRTGCRFR